MKVKICGLTRAEDVEKAAEYGADALGFIFEKSSPRFVPPDQRAFIRSIEPYLIKVAVYGRFNESPKPPAFNAVQFAALASPVDAMTPFLPVYHVLRPRSSDPTILLWDAKETLHETLGHIAAFVLDAYDEEMYGGTGKKVDWILAAEFVRASPRPVILAGGLTPDNVNEAIEIVRPYAVDVSSGVESAPGIKDHIKMRDFIQAAKASEPSP